MNFKTFLLAEQPDFKGRMIQDIWNFSDEEIESQHDFIQIIFPLNKKSQSVFHGHYLENEEIIKSLKNDEQIKQAIIKSSSWFLSFLKRNYYWNNRHDHNHLRITRVIESLRLIVSNEEADKFHKSILEIIKGNNKINNRTLEFWKNA
jgi:hypothetical protein|tara:strand:- start:972 stop:1415 length:444 start_codon:yes stop_codon:yes gene_type:complete